MHGFIDIINRTEIYFPAFIKQNWNTHYIYLLLHIEYETNI